MADSVKKRPLSVNVSSGWGDFAFDLPDDTIDEFIKVVAALSRWHSVDVDSLVITERDTKTGRFKRAS